MYSHCHMSESFLNFIFLDKKYRLLFLTLLKEEMTLFVIGSVTLLTDLEIFIVVPANKKTKIHT